MAVAACGAQSRPGDVLAQRDEAGSQVSSRCPPSDRLSDPDPDGGRSGADQSYPRTGSIRAPESGSVPRIHRRLAARADVGRSRCRTVPGGPPVLAPTVVIVSGPPGTGKTYLARQLATRLTLPWYSRDAIKESLFDTLGWSDPSE
ncbi:AAA family ATPase [Streptomyces sp. NPDC057543]|uniref:AAA family ATPase n=1 Tax=Streptomyces sp. NPDC057543 TaxID=3346163 RepID=UPI00369402AE